MEKGSRAISLLDELTEGLERDPTNPTAAAIKVSQPLEPDGLNLNPWIHDLVNCAIAKQCIDALKKPLPATKANSAALHLILSSIPKELTYLAARMTAYDALKCLSSRYQGGSDKSINNEWFRRLSEEGMTREETLEQYVLRKHSLYENLVDNQHPLSPDDLTRFIIDGLPPEFGHGRASLYAPCAGDDPNKILRFLRLYAHGIKFNDRIPRPAPKAAKALIPDSEGSTSTKGTKGKGRPRCGQCGEFGHISKECTKWKEHPPAEPRKPLPQPCSSPCSTPVVTHNIVYDHSGSGQGEEWLVDSGASVHLTNDCGVVESSLLWDGPIFFAPVSNGHRNIGRLDTSNEACLRIMRDDGAKAIKVSPLCQD
jgi:hypothetical protein